MPAFQGIDFKRSIFFLCGRIINTMIILKQSNNLRLNRAQQHPNDEYYTSKEEVDFIMSILVKALPKRTLWVFACDDEKSEFVKWAKEHKLICVYNIDMFWAPAIIKLKSQFYDKVILITNPPFSLLKYWLPLLPYLFQDLQDKFCYLLLLPLTILTARFARPLFTVPGHEVKEYGYPGKNLFYKASENKWTEMKLVVFFTDLNLDNYIPEPRSLKQYWNSTQETLILPTYTLRFERSFHKNGYYLSSLEAEHSHSHDWFAKIVWKKEAKSI